MKLKIQLQHPNAKTPTYGTDGAGCFDLYAATVNGSRNVGEFVTPGHPVICDTGVSFEVPEGYVLAIKSRSGLAFKYGVFAFPGEVDSDFRGSVQVMLISPQGHYDKSPYTVRPGDRVAQARIVPAPRVEFEVCEQLSLTERGEGGFGHTGAA